MAQDKDRMIITQSQLKLVMDYNVHIQSGLSLKEIVGITNVMVDYCMNGYCKEIGDRLDTIDKFLEEKSRKYHLHSDEKK